MPPLPTDLPVTIALLQSLNPAQILELLRFLPPGALICAGLYRSSKPLSRELELLRHYLEIEKTRFGPRLTIKENIDEDCLTDVVPALLLQPLAENAIVHGISGIVERGVLHVAARHSAI